MPDLPTGDKVTAEVAALNPTYWLTAEAIESGRPVHVLTEEEMRAVDAFLAKKHGIDL